MFYTTACTPSMTPPSSASVGLEQGERDRDDESDDRAKVGKDIKKAQHHPDHRTELESDEAEADGVEHAHDETDDELAAKKNDTTIETNSRTRKTASVRTAGSRKGRFSASLSAGRLRERRKKKDRSA